MTDAEILRMKFNLADCALDNKGKEDFWTFMMYLVLEMK